MVTPLGGGHRLPKTFYTRGSLHCACSLVLARATSASKKAFSTAHCALTLPPRTHVLTSTHHTVTRWHHARLLSQAPEHASACTHMEHALCYIAVPHLQETLALVQNCAKHVRTITAVPRTCAEQNSRSLVKTVG